jgi:hypothetical protein
MGDGTDNGGEDVNMETPIICSNTPYISTANYLSGMGTYGTNLIQQTTVAKAGDAAGGLMFKQAFSGTQDDPLYDGFKNKIKLEKNNMRRIVQVFIADTDENLPLNKSVLYQGAQKLTDMNDQELYFEIPIVDLLAKHNESRVKTLDKSATRKHGKDIFLEEAKIRDLKMVVVNVATF